MTDDLDDLKAAMRAATPQPDADAKAAHLALAQKNFADLQGSRDGARLTSDGPKTGLWIGVKNMLNALTTRAGMTATTALVAVGFVVLGPLGDDLISPPASKVAPPPVERLRLDDTASLSEPVVQDPVVLEEAEAAGAVEVLPSDLSKRSENIAVRERRNISNVASPTGGGLEAYDQQSVSRLVAPAPSADSVITEQPDTEAFANAESNPLKITSEEPVSTFSIDVDTASYAVVRNSLMNGRLPTPDAVRIEEMVNYFTYDYGIPEKGDAFRPTVSVTPTPWNADTRLVQIGIQGEMPDLTERPPLNLVFLIDTSGSMNQPNKLPLLKQSFRLMLGQLRPEDQVAIVTYAGSAGEVLAPTPAGERDVILAALEQLGAGGSTAGQAGLQQAYATAARMSEDGDVSRVILATDGDFNVGLSDTAALETYIESQRESGTYLSVLGFGRGNLDDAIMQTLAQNGNGQAAYIDTLAEAQKVLVDQLTGALFPIANDVKIQVEFNPAEVAEYRLIGYETRALRREDFNNDAVDAGDIGAGHRVTALYEVTPVGSPAQLSDPLRYSAEPAVDGNGELGFLRLRYKAPGATVSELIETPIQAGVTGEAGFAAAVAGFGQLLSDGSYVGAWNYGDAIALASATRGDDPFGYRAEAVQLMRLAQSLSAR